MAGAYTASLADWAARLDRTFPGHSLDRARAAILDSACCMLGGMTDHVPTTIDDAIAPWFRANGIFSRGLPSLMSALVGGAAAHALDFDDNFFPPITHASAVLTPALLALAAETGCSQQEVLDAYIVGLEVQARLGQAANPAHYASGWHATSTLGVMGAAAACGRLLKLDARGMLHAVSLGFSLSGGSKLQFGSPAKPAHAGFAAMHAVLAAVLARAGLTGNPEPFVGKWGFLDLFNGENAAPTLPDLFPDAPLAIDTFGLVAKLYPSCMSSHLGIDGILALRRRGLFDKSAPVSVEIHMPAYMIANLRFSDPRDEMEARFSMNYCGAVAIRDGVPRLGHFTRDALARQELRELLPLITMHPKVPSPEAAELPWKGDAVVSVRFANGETHAADSLYPKGCNQNPLTPEELRRKFLDCANRAVSGEAAESLYQRFVGFGGDAPCADLAEQINTALRARMRQ